LQAKLYGLFNCLNVFNLGDRDKGHVLLTERFIIIFSAALKILRLPELAISLGDLDRTLRDSLAFTDIGSSYAGRQCKYPVSS